MLISLLTHPRAQRFALIYAIGVVVFSLLRGSFGAQQ